MNAFRQYWTFSAIRGALTLVIAGGILLVPHLAAAIFKFPVLVGLAVTVLAVYNLFDAGAISLLAILMPAQARSRMLLYLQAAGALAMGATLFSFANGSIDLRLLLPVIALQAALVAAVEVRVARDTHAEYRCLSCYATAMVLAACAIVLPFASGLDASGVALVLSGFAAAYGISQLALGGRMLFAEYRVGHPAPVMSQAWRAEMQLQPAVPAAAACAGCDGCPAEASCRDNSSEGQLVSVMQARTPSIVRAARVFSLVEPAGVYRSRHASQVAR